MNYSMTSSARPNKGSGTVTPSALAVFKFMTNCTFVDCDDRQIGRFFTVENFPSLKAHLPVVFRFIASVADQPPGRRKSAIVKNSRHPLTK